MDWIQYSVSFKILFCYLHLIFSVQSGRCRHGIQYYDRYKKLVMHPETKVFDANEAPCMVLKQWMNVLNMKKAFRSAGSAGEAQLTIWI